MRLRIWEQLDHMPLPSIEPPSERSSGRATAEHIFYRYRKLEALLVSRRRSR